MRIHNFLGFVLIATIGCASSDSANASPEAEADQVAEAVHRGDDVCHRTYFVTKDKRVAQAPRDDVELIDTLVPHHEAAVEMAMMEIERGENPDIKAMAEQMKTTQSREIEQLRAIRERLAGCSDITPLRDRHMQQDMDAMKNATGSALDRLFLVEMIPHHASALSFSHNALPNLEEDELTTLARQVIDAQSMEIGHMHMMLTDLDQP